MILLINFVEGLSAAQVLALRAKSKGSTDNTSIIIVYLKDMETLCSSVKDRIPPDFDFEATSKALDSEGADEKQKILQEPSEMTLSELINSNPDPEINQDLKTPHLDLVAEKIMENLNLSSDVPQEKSLVEENLIGDFDIKGEFTAESLGDKNLVADLNMNSTTSE